MDKNEIRRDVIEQVRGLINARKERVGPTMDDYDGGLVEGYNNVLKDLDIYDMIIDHHEKK